MFTEILWNVSPEWVVGAVHIRWYGLIFSLSLFLGGWVVYQLFISQKINIKYFSPLIIYAFFGIFIGARLAHCFLYEPDYYLSHPLEIVLPVTILEDGEWSYVGYQGLASHGGAFGLMITLCIYCWHYRLPYLQIADMLAIATPLTGAFIRFGNLMNSEIFGSPTLMPWGVVFQQVDLLPRHPSQLYEAIAYLVIFLTSIWLYRRIGNKYRNGFYLGYNMTLVAIVRFLIEFTKEMQSPLEKGMLITMGQALTIPFMLLGLGLLFFSMQTKKQRLV